jgi:phosphopantothenoylcysteine decarboxylase/phosphopantothenate--cysteine ligase
MRIIITAGPTHEPIDPVRYIGNRSSGRMGAALAAAAAKAGHQTTLVVGPVSIPMPQGVRRIDVETAEEMEREVMDEFPHHDLAILAAAVADFRPKVVHTQKIARLSSLFVEFESTPDIAAEIGQLKLPHQRTIGFSLESSEDIGRVLQKLKAKNLDLIVYNSLQTLKSPNISPVLVYADGRSDTLGSASKADFADILLQRAAELWR